MQTFVKITQKLVEKLTVALSELSKLGIKAQVVQGDMMYTSSDLKKTTHERSISHLNLTQSYMQYQKMTFRKFIKKTKMGIIFHTTYTIRH